MKVEKDTYKKNLGASSGREIFTLSGRNYITHYQVRKGTVLLAIVLLAMFIGLMLLQLSIRAALVASGTLMLSFLLAVYPFVGLFVQVGLYFQPVAVWGGPGFLRPIFLVSLITAVFFLLNFVVIKKQRVKFPTECKLVLLLFSFMVLSSFFAVHSTSLSFSDNMIFLKVIIFYFLVINLVNSKKELNAFIWVIIIFCSTVAFEAIRIYRYYGVARVDTVGGVHRGANFLAAILVMVLPLIFQKINSRNIYERVICFGLMPIFLMAIVVTGSRGGTLGLLVVLGLLAWGFRRKARNVLFLALIVLAAGVMAPSHYWTRSKTIANYDEARTAQTRIELWKIGLQMYQKHPLTGVGQGNFIWITPQYTHSYSSWTREGHVAHNTFIQLLAEGGVQALLAFLAFLVWTFRGLRRARRTFSSLPGGESLRDLSQAVEIGLIGYLVCVLFLSGTKVDIFYWLLALGPVLSFLAERETDRRLEFAGSEEASEGNVAGPVDIS